MAEIELLENIGKIASDGINELNNNYERKLLKQKQEKINRNILIKNKGKF